MDARSKNNFPSVIHMYYAENSDLSAESSYIRFQNAIQNYNARLERIL